MSGADERIEYRVLAEFPMTEDGTAHIAACGYTDESPDCGCYTLPGRIRAALLDHVAAEQSRTEAAVAQALREVELEVRDATSIPITARAAICAVLRGRASRAALSDATHTDAQPIPVREAGRLYDRLISVTEHRDVRKYGEEGTPFSNGARHMAVAVRAEFEALFRQWYDATHTDAPEVTEVDEPKTCLCGGDGVRYTLGASRDCPIHGFPEVTP